MEDDVLGAGLQFGPALHLDGGAGSGLGDRSTAPGIQGQVSTDLVDAIQRDGAIGLDRQVRCPDVAQGDAVSVDQQRVAADRQVDGTREIIAAPVERGVAGGLDRSRPGDRDRAPARILLQAVGADLQGAGHQRGPQIDVARRRQHDLATARTDGTGDHQVATVGDQRDGAVRVGGQAVRLQQAAVVDHRVQQAVCQLAVEEDRAAGGEDVAGVLHGDARRRHGRRRAGDADHRRSSGDQLDLRLTTGQQRGDAAAIALLRTRRLPSTSTRPSRPSRASRVTTPSSPMVCAGT